MVGLARRRHDVASQRAREPESESERLALLTERELEVLVEMAENHTNPEIAELLVISLDTVKTHVKRIFEKLGVSDRGEAARIYRAEITRNG
ncbi:MAG: response regulator transcription factor [Dehalococcoidia bacterium]